MADSEDPAGAEALAQAVHAVYAAPPERFVAVRKEEVARLRAEGRRDLATQVAALRKPSAAAAAVNALVRADDEVVERLRDVGVRMRHAQSALDASAMAALRGEREDLLNAWVAAAREHAPGGGLTAAVEAEVRDTAVAALADAAATEVVASGNLTRALSYSGFGEVDIADAVARTSTGVVLTRLAGGRSQEQQPEEADEPEDEDTEPSDEADDDGDGDVAQEVAEPDADEDSEVSEEAADEDADGEVAEGPDEPEDEDWPDEDGDEPDRPDEPDSTNEADDDERVAALEMELDEAEKVVASARAARKRAAEAATEAERELGVAQEQVAQAERLLAGARRHLETALARHTQTAGALEAAEDELRASRRHRDAARAALEEAEDR